MTDDDSKLLADVLDYTGVNLDNMLVLEMLWEADSDSFFSAGDRSVISKALKRLSTTVLTLRFAFADLLLSSFKKY